MRKFVHEVLEEVAKKRSNKDKVEILKANDSGALRDVLRGSMDKTIVWLLPEGDPPPYTPNKPESTPSNLLKETVQLAYLVKGGKGPKLQQVRRERIFISLLESIHPKDAEILLDMINKKPPKGVTRSVVKEAFPGLLLDEK